MATVPVTGTAPAAPAEPSGPSAEPLPDFGGVDVAAVAARTGHPVLGRWPPSCCATGPAERAVAYYDDGPGPTVR